MILKKYGVVASALCAGLTGTPAFAASSAEEHNLTELRNTVVNLLQALVDRGVVTREQAEGMVRDAKTKAEAEANAQAAQKEQQEKEDAGAIRVPYVPQIVKDQIRKEVLAELGPSVTRQVVEEAKSGNTLRAALPDWMKRISWGG